MKISSNHLFYLGSHSENVKLAQLRMNCSKLNAHLFSLHVVDSPKCVCGCAVEDTSHFLMKCPLYHIDRQILFQTLYNHGIHDFDVSLLLYGSNDNSFLLNSHIVNAVHTFIDKSGRL